MFQLFISCLQLECNCSRGKWKKRLPGGTFWDSFINKKIALSHVLEKKVYLKRLV